MIKKGALALSFLFIAACGSSNGGDAGGVISWPPTPNPPQPYPTFPTEPLGYDNILELFSTNRSIGDVITNVSTNSTLTITNLNTITIANTATLGTGALFAGSSTLNISDFQRLLGPANTQFYIGRTDRKNVNLTDTAWHTNVVGGTGPNGSTRWFNIEGKTAVADDTLILGGKAVGLQHSDFGIWNTQRRIEGYLVCSINGLSQEGWFDSRTVAFRTSLDTSAFLPTGMTGTRIFTGSAVAVASNGMYGSSQLRTQTVFGSAELTIDLSQVNMGASALNSLVLDFPYFYSFSFDVSHRNGNVGISTGGTRNVGLLGGGSVLSIENTGNRTNISFDGGSLSNWVGNVDGAFFGVPGDPSEVVGTFNISNIGTNAEHRRETLSGAFGVKR